MSGSITRKTSLSYLLEESSTERVERRSYYWCPECGFSFFQHKKPSKCRNCDYEEIIWHDHE